MGKTEMGRRVLRERYGVWLGDVAWPEVMHRLKDSAIAVLPIGAGAKEHGQHLPMSADHLQARWLADQLTQMADVVVWPVVTYGYYPAFSDYPGSVTLTADTFDRLISEILASILGSGAHRVLLLNTGISTIEPLTQICARPAHRERVRLANVYEGEQYRATASRVRQEARGGHAGELETSILLAIAPESVHLYKAEAWESERMGPGPLRRLDKHHANYSPTGVFGNPTLATRATGELLLQAMLQDLALIFDKKMGAAAG